MVFMFNTEKILEQQLKEGPLPLKKSQFVSIYLYVAKYSVKHNETK